MAQVMLVVFPLSLFLGLGEWLGLPTECEIQRGSALYRVYSRGDALTLGLVLAAQWRSKRWVASVSACAFADVIEPRFEISEFFRRLVVFGFAHVRFMGSGNQMRC
jgi:hypothetical protein